MGTKLVFFVAVIALCSPLALSNTLTFDDVSSGSSLSGSAYNNLHRVFFTESFRAADHVGSAWGLPHSRNNVLTSVGSTLSYVPILFGRFGANYSEWDHVQSVSAYFGTDVGAVVRITAYHVVPSQPSVVVTSVVIGAATESWNNEMVTLNAPSGLSFEELKFEGVNSSNDLTSFCLDDMAIVPTPEPSSLLALGGGLLGLGLLRRRSKQ